MTELQNTAELFLRKYREIECILEKKYEGRRLSASSFVIAYLQDPESEGIRHELNLLKELRNMLTHNALTGGEAVAMPTPGTLQLCDTVLAHIRTPQMAISYATLKDSVLWASPEHPVFETLQVMSRRGFSLVPVLEDGIVTGIFSSRVIFNYLAGNEMKMLPRNARVRELGEYLLLNRENGDRCVFIPKDMTIRRARERFGEAYEPNRRVVMLLITETGRADEALIGVLTPWDTFRQRARTGETET